ncbi:MAG: biopolymer transporter ExbD [Bacteroidota bacterium]
MRSKRTAPDINAGSMADIAFLLLIFFLVAASIDNDTGLNRILPREHVKTTVNIKKRNLFEISINPQNDLMVEGELVEFKDLRGMTIAFIDNGGLVQGQKGFCGYCQGEQSAFLSEHPNQAIISLSTSRNSDYAFYVSVQNEIIGAYNFLRNREGLKLFGTDYESLVSNYNKAEVSVSEKSMLKKKIETLRLKYPQKLVEPETIYH